MTLLAQSGSTLVSLTLRFQPMGKDMHREKGWIFQADLCSLLPLLVRRPP